MHREDGIKKLPEGWRILDYDHTTWIPAASWPMRPTSTMVPQQLEPLVTADYAAWFVCMLTTFWGRDAQLRPPGKESSKSCSPCLTFVNGKMVTSCNTVAAPSRNCLMEMAWSFFNRPTWRRFIQWPFLGLMDLMWSWLQRRSPRSEGFVEHFNGRVCNPHRTSKPQFP